MIQDINLIQMVRERGRTSTITNRSSLRMRMTWMLSMRKRRRAMSKRRKKNDHMDVDPQGSTGVVDSYSKL